MQNNTKIIIGVVVATVMVAVYGVQVYASHTFETGTQNTFSRHTQGGAPLLPNNTTVRLDGLTLQPGAVLPIYDASPNFVSGHLLLRAPCEPVEGEGDDTYRPLVTVIAGHIDEHEHNTYVDKVPLYYIRHASNRDSCVWHAHIPDPLNGGAPRVTDLTLINLTDQPVEFNGGDVVVFNVFNVLGTIGNYYAQQDMMQLPTDIEHGNPVYDLNDEDDSNDGLGFIE